MARQPAHPEPESEPPIRPPGPTAAEAGSVEPAAPGTLGSPTGTGSFPPAPPEPGRAPRPTLAGRVWVTIGCAAVLLVLLIIFIAENSHRVTISFLGAHGHISEALALLIAVVVGIAITLLVGSARIIQLSLEVRRGRRELTRRR